MENKADRSLTKAKKLIASERKRTNILRKSEHHFIAYLVQRIPAWLSSDMLTAIGFIGNLIVCISFILAAILSLDYLLLGPVGFFISWFGDSLDGRIAYYRKTPRKWYGFTLDITVDWLGTVAIGSGFIIYMQGWWSFLGFLFVILYGWEMITKILGYKITGSYSIDSGLLGPTEVRIIVASAMILEYFLPTSIIYFGIIAILILLIFNIIDSLKLLKKADLRDKEERSKTDV